MDNLQSALNALIDTLQGAGSLEGEDSCEIPVGVSNRHIHLSQEDLEKLFGKGYELIKLKDLSQPGQYACNEVVTICGPKGAIEKVRVLGPTRSSTQVEVLRGDLFKLGISAPVRMSGDLKGSSGLVLVGPKGSVHLEEGVIVAQRHIHMTPADAQRLGVTNGEKVSIEIVGLRGGRYNNVVIRADENAALECHLDIEEANAMGIDGKTKIRIIK